MSPGFDKEVAPEDPGPARRRQGSAPDASSKACTRTQEARFRARWIKTKGHAIARRGKLNSRAPQALPEWGGKENTSMDLSILCWPKLGLILNFIGTILVAISVDKNPGGVYQDGRWGKIYLAVFYPVWFRIGLCLLALGFLFNIF